MSDIYLAVACMISKICVREIPQETKVKNCKNHNPNFVQVAQKMVNFRGFSNFFSELLDFN